MGGGDGINFVLSKIHKGNGYPYQTIGFFPQLFGPHPNLVDDGLFVNAWDCWSVPGNGNKLDPTLDGHIGRVTGVGYLGCGLTNPNLLENLVPL
jgi:hypothetical protein